MAFVNNGRFEKFENKIWLASPTMYPESMRYVMEAYETNWMSTVGANINEVEKYKNAELYVTREDAIDLEEGEYFICDLIGLDVVDEDSNVIGKLTDVLQSAANDVYEITDNSGKTHLFPAIKECVLNVNLDEGRMYVHVMKGLMDL